MMNVILKHSEVKSFHGILFETTFFMMINRSVVFGALTHTLCHATALHLQAQPRNLWIILAATDERKQPAAVPSRPFVLCPKLCEQAPCHGLVEVQTPGSANFVGICSDENMMRLAVVAARPDEPEQEQPLMPHRKIRGQLHISELHGESMIIHVVWNGILWGMQCSSWRSRMVKPMAMIPIL